MSRQYRGSDHTWTSLLTNDPAYPIPAEWVLELSRSFVGDLSTNVPCTGVFISSISCPWEAQLPMLEAFSIPIWVCYDGNAALNMKLCHYIPSPKAIADAIKAQKLDQMHGTWGQPYGTWGQPDNGSESIIDWDQAWSQGTLRWDLDGGEHRPVSAGPQ
ncbi:uncharacterized protein EDB91DRAFT_1251047 [Suillus paluster]|uniref:uncharacterized protein n=1 Tax=Suillus paluster TaxID=48578 RepID=UPI001B860F5B|nr:uncharacterized protein EDB91DRAFT_1251047 [Suillus paluster]KAG1734254.1 hypothetical protein EDB91DRAFT_1251047 [Suillus paluster]